MEGKNDANVPIIPADITLQSQYKFKDNTLRSYKTKGYWNFHTYSSDVSPNIYIQITMLD
jgi:hypothetical protein